MKSHLLLFVSHVASPSFTSWPMLLHWKGQWPKEFVCSGSHRKALGSCQALCDLGWTVSVEQLPCWEHNNMKLLWNAGRGKRQCSSKNQRCGYHEGIFFISAIHSQLHSSPPLSPPRPYCLSSAVGCFCWHRWNGDDVVIVEFPTPYTTLHVNM